MFDRFRSDYSYTRHILTLRILYLLGEEAPISQTAIATELDVSRRVVKNTVDFYIKYFDLKGNNAASLLANRLARHHRDLKYVISQIDI
jgi:predicted regulator of amino acid metabolism with ACT domain